MTIALLAAWLLTVRVRTRREQRPIPTSLADFAALLELATRGGLALHSSLLWAAEYVDDSLREELLGVLRRATQVGLARALRACEAPAAAVLRPLARSIETGATAAPILAGLQERLHAEHAVAHEERLQKLPVRLLLPLALLMLPGLLLMVVAPALIDTLSRFG